MAVETKTRLRSVFKLILWVLLAQLVLANISAALYAYRFTHYYESPPSSTSPQNIFSKTWRLFSGPRFYKQTNEIEPGFPFREVQLSTSANISINSWYSTVDSSKGCVLLFHGVTANKSYVLNEASKFRQWGYNVLLVDFRGHGKSGGNNGSFGVKESEEVQKAFAFAKEEGNKKIILYGISMGAAVIMRAVAFDAITPDGIIAEMPFASLHSHLRSRAREVGFPNEPFAWLVTFWMGVERGYNGFEHDVAGYAKKINCPILLECGDQDRYISPQEIGEIYSNLASARKKLVIYQGAGHESLLASDPVNWEKEMVAFLAGLP